MGAEPPLGGALTGQGRAFSAQRLDPAAKTCPLAPAVEPPMRESRWGGRLEERRGRTVAEETATQNEQVADLGAAEPFVGWGDTAVAVAESPVPAGSQGTWYVAGKPELIKALKEAGRELGVEVVALDGPPDFELPRRSVVLVEMPDAQGEAVLAKAKRSGALGIAILDEPTIEWFTRVIRAGARDVLAGRPDAARIRERASRWSR